MYKNKYLQGWTQLLCIAFPLQFLYCLYTSVVCSHYRSGQALREMPEARPGLAILQLMQNIFDSVNTHTPSAPPTPAPPPAAVPAAPAGFQHLPTGRHLVMGEVPGVEGGLAHKRQGPQAAAPRA